MLNDASELLDLIPVQAVIRLTGLSRAALYARIANGTFPKQLRLGHRAVWRMSEVVAWARAGHD
jgi:prophage regulatory protein